MKNTILLSVALILCTTLMAQAPQGISHQAVIRNTQGELVTGQNIGVRVSILQSSAEGTAVFVETHEPESNENGLITYVIGNGTNVSGSFEEIDWADGPYFLKTEADPAGGSSYSIEGMQQLFSVPYALQAKKAENVPTGTATGQMLYWNGSSWINVAPGSSGQILTLVNGVPTWTGTSASSTDVVNPITGKIWMDRNLGATQVATSSTDANSYGHLYQWGRGSDGHQVRTSGTTTTLSSSNSPGHTNFILAPSSPYDWRSPQNDNLWQGVFGVNNPCPSGYRLPTNAEWNAERVSWSTNNAAGAYASPLKLPVAGSRYTSSGSLYYVGSSGVYWSSAVAGTYSRSLGFDSSHAAMYNSNRALGLSVRCLKD